MLAIGLEGINNFGTQQSEPRIGEFIGGFNRLVGLFAGLFEAHKGLPCLVKRQTGGQMTSGTYRTVFVR